MRILQRWLSARLLIRANGYVYAVAGQGIGNRLKHLASACAAAAFYRHNVRAWWRRDAGLDCEWQRLLSKTRHIVAAYKSSFSEMAWWWGDATLEVVGVDVPRPQA